MAGRNQTPEQREEFDKIVKKVRRKIRREEIKAEKIASFSGYNILKV
jgi:hypothetical protein